MFLFCRLLLLEKGSEDFNTLSQILTETSAGLTYPLGTGLTSSQHFALYSSYLCVSSPCWYFFSDPENKSYSSVRTEALSVVDLIVKRTGGTCIALTVWWWTVEIKRVELIIFVQFQVTCPLPGTKWNRSNRFLLPVFLFMFTHRWRTTVISNTKLLSFLLVNV